MSPSGTRVLFSEEQRRGTAPATILALVALLTAGLVILPMGWGMSRQLLLGARGKWIPL